MKEKTKNIILWITRIVVAGILLNTLRYKFSAHPQSVLIFSSLGVEPYGRIILGIIELIVAILILIPRTSMFGAIGSSTIMIGAILSHLMVIGVNFDNDGGALFIAAWIVLIASIINLYLNKEKLKKLIGK